MQEKIKNKQELHMIKELAHRTFINNPKVKLLQKFNILNII